MITFCGHTALKVWQAITSAPAVFGSLGLAIAALGLGTVNSVLHESRWSALSGVVLLTALGLWVTWAFAETARHPRMVDRFQGIIDFRGSHLVRFFFWVHLTLSVLGLRDGLGLDTVADALWVASLSLAYVAEPVYVR